VKGIVSVRRLLPSVGARSLCQVVQETPGNGEPGRPVPGREGRARRESLPHGFPAAARNWDSFFHSPAVDLLHVRHRSITPEPRRFSIRLPGRCGSGRRRACWWSSQSACGSAFRSTGSRWQSGRRLGGTVQTRPRGLEWLREWVGDEWMKRFDGVVVVDLDGKQAFYPIAD